VLRPALTFLSVVGASLYTPPSEPCHVEHHDFPSLPGGQVVETSPSVWKNSHFVPF